MGAVTFWNINKEQGLVEIDQTLGHEERLLRRDTLLLLSSTSSVVGMVDLRCSRPLVCTPSHPLFSSCSSSAIADMTFEVRSWSLLEMIKSFLTSDILGHSFRQSSLHTMHNTRCEIKSSGSLFSWDILSWRSEMTCLDDCFSFTRDVAMVSFLFDLLRSTSNSVCSSANFTLRLIKFPFVTPHQLVHQSLQASTNKSYQNCKTQLI